MKTLTFELAIPIRKAGPQWLQFICEVNDLAKLEQDDKPVPFDSPLFARTIGGVGIEGYAEALIVHTDTCESLDPDPDPSEEYTAYIRFEATSVRLCRLFATAVPKFDEAQPGLGLQTRDAGEWYTYQRLRAKALRLQIEAEDNEARVIALTRQLELAENVGD